MPTAAEKEARRTLAICKVPDGRTQADVAGFLGVHPVSVVKWMKAYRAGGEQAVAAKPVPGRPRLWTVARVAQRIRDRLGVAFHPNDLYVNREGCSWRTRPHDFPHWKTVYNFFRAFEADGTWDKLVTALRVEVRTTLGRDPTPGGACIDSQSAKPAHGGAEVGGGRREDGAMANAAHRHRHPGIAAGGAGEGGQLGRRDHRPEAADRTTSRLPQGQRKFRSKPKAVA